MRDEKEYLDLVGGLSKEVNAWQPIAQMPDLAAQPRDVRTLDVFGRLADGSASSSSRSSLLRLADPSAALTSAVGAVSAQTDG